MTGKYTAPLLTLLFLVLSLAATLYLSRNRQSFQNQAATGPTIVTIKNGQFLVNGSSITIHGLSYGAIPIGSSGPDLTAPAADAPKMASLGVNTIRLYSSYNNDLYTALYPEAEKNNLYLILGFFLQFPNTQAGINSQTTFFKNRILEAKSRPSTLIYSLGNEQFESLSAADKVTYAQWLESMTVWIHQNDPNHPVMYADTDYAQAGLPLLKQYVPDLDIYAVNYYHFRTAATLVSFYDNNMSGQLPGKMYLISEYGSDSYNNTTGLEDQNAQATRAVQLAQAIDSAHSSRQRLIGGVYFSFLDNWSKCGSTSLQNNCVEISNCTSCFDGVANSEYWGVADATYSGQAATRPLKLAYTALQAYWGGSSPTLTPTLTPTATPTPTGPLTSLLLKAKFAGIASNVGPIVATAVVVQDKVPTGSVHNFKQVFSAASSGALTFNWNTTDSAYEATTPGLQLDSTTTYEVLIKGPSHLQTRVTPSGFTITSAQTGTTVPIDTTGTPVRGGDVVDISTNPPTDGQDGKLTLEDLTAITFYYTGLSTPLCTSPGVPAGCENIPARRDINKDGFLTLEDITLVSNNLTALTIYDDQ